MGDEHSRPAVLVYEDGLGSEPNAETVRGAFKAMQDAYADAVATFATKEGRIESARFARRVAALATKTHRS